MDVIVVTCSLFLAPPLVDTNGTKTAFIFYATSLASHAPSVSETLGQKFIYPFIRFIRERPQRRNGEKSKNAPPSLLHTFARAFSSWNICEKCSPC